MAPPPPTEEASLYGSAPSFSNIRAPSSSSAAAASRGLGSIVGGYLGYEVVMDEVGLMSEEVSEDERQQVVELTRRLALDGGGEGGGDGHGGGGGGPALTFVKLEAPGEVAVIVPHSLHFGAVEHLDYNSADMSERLAVQESESPMANTRVASAGDLKRVKGGAGGGGGGGVGGGDGGGGGAAGGSAGWSASDGDTSQAHPLVVWLAIMLTGLGTGLVSVVLTNISVGFGNTRLQEANELLALNRPLGAGAVWVSLSVVFTALAAGAYTRPLLSST